MIRTALSDFLRWIDSRTPRQGMWLCFALGVISALAMPPVHATPLLAVTFPLWLRLLDKAQTTKQAFAKAFLFHLGFHIAGLYWITNALFVDIANNWWVIPFALVSLPAALAVYPALAVSLWFRMAWQGTARFIALIVLLAVSEWVRGIAFTGFPWNLWGYTWVAFLPVMQISAIIGIYGLTLLTLFLACMPALLYPRYRERGLRLVALGVVALFIISTVWGMGRLSIPQTVSKDAYQVRIVQPNIKQEAKWNPEKSRAIERLLWTYSVQPHATQPDLIVWPETALGLFRTEDVSRLQYYAQHFLNEKTVLAMGALEAERDPDSGKPIFFNRINFMNHTGSRNAYYDKFHLVPFGEYLPFQDLWPVRPIAFQSGSLQQGTGLQTIDNGAGITFSPMICYEIIFPNRIVHPDKRPHAILNVTNDAWYGNTSGPYQHFAITRTRAIEEGLPVIRAANTGISGMIDPFGRVVEKRALNTKGIIDAALPPRLDPTIFARFGHTLFYALLVLLWAVAWGFQRTRSQKIAYVR